MAADGNAVKPSLRRSKSWDVWRKQCYTYQYSRLKSRHIRLLELLPGKVSEPIKIRIKVVDVINRPSYEALSYVWGAATKKLYEIRVDGQVETTLNITRNLAIALPYLRHECIARTLWIDAISINQGDLEERSQQVSNMYEIYKGASRVVVWLGEEADDSYTALTFFGDLSRNVEMDVQRERVVYKTDTDSDAMNQDYVRLGRKKSYAILHLLGRPWFGRLWVAQEIRAARSCALVMCGQRCMRWRSFCKGIYYIFNENSTLSLDPCDRDTYHRRKRAVYMLVNMVQAATAMRGFLDIRCSTAHMRCTDPRDYIYALQGLLPLEKRIKSDYRKSAEEVYEDITTHIIRVENNLKILTECDMLHCESHHPTWVPRFNVSSVPKGFEPSSFGPCLTPPRIVSMTEHKLRLAGVVLECVQKVTAVRIPFLTMQEVVSSLQSLSSTEEMHATYIGGGSVLEAWCRTLIKDDFADSYLEPWIRRPKFEVGLRELSNALDARNDSTVNSSPSWYFNHVKMHTSGRSLLTTEGGHCGLASQAVAPGDEVCAILGFRRPMILRQVHDSCYKVVGPAYIHGLGDNEALIGPLPAGWKGISGKSDEGYMLRKFKEVSTGVITMHDPRLGKELPEGWAFVDDTTDSSYPEFRKEGTSEPTWEDPRTTYQGLKQRGVEIEHLTLT